MNGLARFFAGVGHLLGSVFGIIKEAVPEQLLITAINLAAHAANAGLENEARRAFVVAELQRIPGVNENTARLVTEMAVAALKKEVAALAQRATLTVGD